MSLSNSGFRTVLHCGEDQIIEKKSRFIGQVFPVTDEDEANAVIESCRKKYWDARHNCYAYIIGTGSNPLKRFSDDGEPSGTAGKPILETLEKKEVTNCLIVVTRYFGGTLLGTGGLVRAYTAAAQAGLEAAGIVSMRMCDRLEMTTDYNGAGKLQYLLGQNGIQSECDYSDCVRITCSVPVGLTEKLTKEIINLTGGKTQPEITGTEYAACHEEL